MGSEPRHSDLPWAPALRLLGRDRQVEDTQEGRTLAGRSSIKPPGETVWAGCARVPVPAKAPRGVPHNLDVPFLALFVNNAQE